MCGIVYGLPIPYLGCKAGVAVSTGPWRGKRHEYLPQSCFNQGIVGMGEVQVASGTESLFFFTSFASCGEEGSAPPREFHCSPDYGYCTPISFKEKCGVSGGGL